MLSGLGESYHHGHAEPDCVRGACLCCHLLAGRAGQLWGLDVTGSGTCGMPATHALNTLRALFKKPKGPHFYSQNPHEHRHVRLLSWPAS